MELGSVTHARPEWTTNQAIQKFHKGDHISDAELKVAIKTMWPTLVLLGELGPKYELAYRELYRIYFEFTTYQNARKIK